jgi:gliding motility-associated-like protein
MKTSRQVKSLFLTRFSWCFLFLLGLVPRAGFSQVPDYVSSTGLLAWYPFSGNANDASGNGRHLSLYNAPTLTGDRFANPGRAYKFEPGKATYMHNSSFPTSYTAYTFAAWIQVDSFYRYQPQSSTGAPAGSNVFAGQTACTSACSVTLPAISLGVNDSSFRLRSVHCSSTGAPRQILATNKNKQWFHMASVWTGTKFYLYINGTLLDSSSVTSILQLKPDLYLGAGFYNQVYYHHAGKLDDIGIWSRALSYCEIGRLYNASIPAVTLSIRTSTQPAADTIRLKACSRDSLKVGIGTHWKSIKWSTAATDSTIWLKKTGQYYVKATDSFGCIAQDSIWFHNPGKPIAQIESTDSVSCYGGNTGRIIAKISGGFAPYSYQWNDQSKQTNRIARDLKKGSYTLYVQDFYGCKDSITAEVHQPDLMYLTLGMNDSVDCFGGSDGALSALASGGTRPYRYVWNDPARQTSSTASGLKAGKYFVQVRDYNGCKDSMEIDLKEPDRVRISLLRNDSVRCFGGSDGSITVIASGGNGLYRYLWNDPAKQKTSTATGLPKGNWKVWAYDQYNCSDSAVLRMNEPARLRVSIASVDSVRCFAGADGRMQASGTGGTLPYSWLWNDPAAQRSQTVVNLARGRYLVRLTDAKGCTDTISRFVAEPTRLLAQISFTDSVRCFSGSDGRAMAQATGGNGGYQYLWNDQFRQTTALASNLFPGPYRVRVTDRKGCRDSVTATVHAPLPMILSILSDSVNCFGGSDGSLQVQVQQGRGPLSFSWTDPARQTGTRASNLRRGTYRVRVTDIRGCRDSMNGTVHEPAQLLAFIVRSDSVNCFGGADGALQGGGSGGSGGYRWQWNDPASQRTATAINLRPGSYIATLRDVYGCSDTAMGSVFQPTPVRISLSGIDSVRCFGGADGRIHTTAIGGSGGYRWRWNDPFGQLASTAKNLRRGTYKAVVRDVYGCSDSLQASVAEPERLDVAITRVDQISCFGGSDGALYSAASGGVPPITWLWNDPAAQRSANALNLRQGRYLVTVRDSKGCTDTASALVREPAPLNIRITQTFPVSCHRLSDAAANTVTSGGTTPYSWSWNSNPPQFTANASNLPAGKYRVVVRDFRGCSDSTEVTFDEPDPIIVQINGNSLTMYGMVHDLEATVLPVGRYTCNWTPQSVFGPGNGNSERPRGIFTESGTVKVIARNTKGCEGEDTAYFTVVLLPEDIMPTAFTPNIDNLNEGFGMPSIFDVEEFTVYDRWGAVVFRASPNQQRWDGRTASGVQVPSGSYTYRLRARLKGTQQYVTHTGKVSLIR